MKRGRRTAARHRRKERLFFRLWAVLLLFTVAIQNTIWAKAVNTQIVIGVAGEMAPLQFVNEDGELTGIHRQMLDTFVENKQDTIRYVCFDTGQTALQALKKGEIDAVLATALRGDPELSSWTTEPLTQMALCAICDKHVAQDTTRPIDYGGMVVAFEYGTAKYAYLDKLGVNYYLAVGDQAQVLEALRSGRADLAVGLKDCLLYELEESGYSEDYTIVKSYLGEMRYCLTVRPGNTVMLHWLKEKLVHLHTTGRYDEIYNSWAAAWTKDTSVLQARVVRYLGIALSAVLTVMLLFAVFSVVLRRQLRRMTGTLHETNAELAFQLSKVQQENTTKQRIIDASTFCILLFERAGRISMLNQAAARIAEQPGELIGRNIMDVTPFGQITAPFLSGSRDRPELPQNEVFRIQRDDGANLLLKCTMLPLRSDGLHEDLMLSAEDITVEEAQKQKLFEAEKSTIINRVVAGIAHEIRNPLMTIRTFANMIQSESGDEEFQKAFYEIVPVEVDRIHALVDRFINYAKPSDIEQSLVYAGNLVEDCLYLTKPVAKRSAIRFDIALEEGLLIRVSANQIKQVVINIIINGIEAMERRLKLQPPDRKLVMEIRTYAQGDQVKISVRDEGIGMSPEALDKCRSPYFTTKPTGIGLGLSLSNELVQLNGGTMTIESQVEDHTTITIAFERGERIETTCTDY